MKQKPCIAVVLADWERKEFLPPQERAALEEVSGKLVEALPSDFADGAAFGDWLAETGAEILVSCWMAPKLPEDLAERAPEVKYVCHLAGSVKGIVEEAHIRGGLLVTNWGNAIARTVAECGLMLAIAALRRVSHWTVQMHFHGGWKERTNTGTGSLFERRVGLHGFGAISRELAQLLRPFNVGVSTYSPSVPDSLLKEFGVERMDSLEDLFSKNDVLIELAALTPKNRGIVTEELLRSIPDGGVFVNIGRGAVVDEAALARVARDGHIQVALDVYGTEPLPEDSEFRGMTNVLLLPHLGGPTVDRRRDATRFGIANIQRYLRGEEPEGLITAEVYQRST